MNIVINDQFKLSSSNIIQNLKDRFITEMTTTSLGDIVDTTSLISIAEGIQGIDRARIIKINYKKKSCVTHLFFWPFFARAFFSTSPLHKVL